MIFSASTAMVVGRTQPAVGALLRAEQRQAPAASFEQSNSKIRFLVSSQLRDSPTPRDLISSSGLGTRSFPAEPIGPLVSKSDGAYIIVDGSSGAIYLWEVQNAQAKCQNMERKILDLGRRQNTPFEVTAAKWKKVNTIAGQIHIHMREENVKKILCAKPLDDGHLWKKYGQKHIAGSKYPRSYFKCRLRKEQGCQAMKHVQQTDSDPEMFLVTNIGRHTCTESIDAFSSADDRCFLKFGSDCSNERAQKWPLTQETVAGHQTLQGHVSSSTYQIPNNSTSYTVAPDTEMNVTLTSPNPSDMDLMDGFFESDVGFLYCDENVSFNHPSSGNA